MVLAPTFHGPAGFPELAAQTRATPELLAAADPAALLVLDGDREVPVAGIAAGAAGWQRRLRAAGVGRGDVVTAQLPNRWETVALAHAVWGMGAVLNPVTTIYRERELGAILAAARPAVVVVPGTYRGTDHVALAAGALAAAGLHAPVLVPDGTAAGTPELDAAVDDVALLMFTSGTTGAAKGVLHSHRTLLAEAASIVRLHGLHRDRVFMPSPLTHITGLVYAVLMPLLMEGDAVLLDRWDPAAAADVVEATRATFCVGATPFLAGLVDEYARRGPGSALRGFVCGGADVPPALVRRGAAVLDAVVVRAYGLTEMPTATCGGPADPETVRADTDGRPVGSAEVRLGPAPGAPEGAGELEVRGPELCLGYLDARHTAEAFTADGWFRTGDLARIDAAGAVTILGRLKDVIVRAGENLPAAEVEGFLLEHPAVADVAVVGVPDEQVGERACAVVVPRPGARPTLADLATHLGGYGIARQKFPEHLLLAGALPRTPSGKVQKFVLRAEAADRLRAGEGESR